MWHAWGRTDAHGVRVGKPGGKRPLGKPTHRWEDNNKIKIKGVGWEYEDWIQLAPDMEKCWAPINTVMSLSVP
jgi:hypothetical protein